MVDEYVKCQLGYTVTYQYIIIVMYSQYVIKISRSKFHQACSMRLNVVEVSKEVPRLK